MKNFSSVFLDSRGIARYDGESPQASGRSANAFLSTQSLRMSPHAILVEWNTSTGLSQHREEGLMIEKVRVKLKISATSNKRASKTHGRSLKTLMVRSKRESVTIHEIQ